MFFFVTHILLLLPLLVNIMFATVYERKILAYAQNRKGPNKASIAGILQPVSDALKMFLQYVYYPSYSMMFFFILGPSISLIIAFMLWLLIPTPYSNNSFKFSVVLLLSVFSVSIYGMVFMGWSSKNKYSYLGAIRGMSQTISYEISMAFVLLMICVVYGSVNMHNFFMLPVHEVCLIIPMTMFIIVFVELGRSPFDLQEAESELVSGYNTEYSSLNFALVSLTEYSMFLLFSSFFSVYIIKTSSQQMWNNMIIFFLIIFIRSCYPRMRYDTLMEVSWLIILPVVLIMFMFSISILF